MSGIFSLAPFIKSKQWSMEQEWRLLLLNENCDASREEGGKVKREKTRLLDMGYPPAFFITSIMISPQGNLHSLRENLTGFLAPGETERLPHSVLHQSVVENYIEACNADEANNSAEFLRYQDFVLRETMRSSGAEVCSFAEFRRTKLGNYNSETFHV